LKSLKVFLINFSLGRNLINENELLNEQLGSPAYISPDILGQNPYLGKPSDIWSLGVILYAMLFGQFPFYDQVPERLFKKVRCGDFIIPS
jgi:serine/threonine-protein kinase 40